MTRSPVLLALAGAAALLATSASVPAGHAHAQEVRKGEAAHPIPYKQESSFGDELVRVGLALAGVVVVGAIVIGGYRYLAGVRPASPGRRLKVVETLRLTPRTALFLVEFDRRTLLIGQHGDRLSLIVGPVESGLPGSRDAQGGDDGSPG